MRKLIGFTLAEVLITMSIIGVVAALTAPALSRRSGMAKIGPTLSKFVNTFENAAGLAMQAEGLTTLTDIENPVIPMNRISENMLVAGSSDSYTYYDPIGGEGGTIIATNTYVLKDGSIFGVIPVENPTELGDKGAYKGIIADVIYDINGNNGNNRAGKDVFKFELDNSGSLIPYASASHKYVDDSIDATCLISGADSSVDTGFACTGEIADHNWKADY